MLVDERPEDAAWVLARHEYAAGLYTKWLHFIEEVLRVYKGEWLVPSETDEFQKTHEIVRPSQPRNIVDKMASMLGVRTQMRISVMPLNRSKGERRRADFLERAVQAWWWTIEEEAQTPYRRDIAYGDALFGRQPVLIEYRPNAAGLYPIQIEVPDPRTVFPVFGRFGPAWYTRQYTLQLGDLKGQFDKIITGEGGWKKPDFSKYEREDQNDWAVPVRVVEYCNAKYRAYLIEGDDFVGPMEHGYGFLPMDEARFKRTPLADEQRYASASVIGPCLDDLKGMAILAAKVSAGMEGYFWPFLLYETESGSPMIVHSDNPPTTWEPMKPGTKPTVIAPSPNHEGVQWLMNWHQKNVSHSTLPEIVYLEDIPQNSSGFFMSTILGVIKDQMDDHRDVLERHYGRLCTYSLKLHRMFADAQTDTGEEDFVPGKFRLPGYIDEEARRKRQKDWLEVGADDISEEHRVEVKIKMALPVDQIQSVAMGVQMRTPDAEGKPLFSRETTHEVMAISDDTTEELARIEKEALAARDPEVQEREMLMAKAAYLADTQDAYEEALKVLERMGKRQEKVMERQMVKDENAPVIIPGDRKFDLALIEEIWELAAQGVDPATAVTQEENYSLANPMPQGESPLLTTEQGRFTGLAGLDNRALPPEGQGAIPRRELDRGNVMAENIEELSRRGGRPPAK